MEEQALIEKLRKIEALFAGTTREGERVAAGRALEKLRRRLGAQEEKGGRGVKKEEQAMEFRFTFRDFWSKKLFVALLRRYEVRPYRYHRQRHTTVMARLTQEFVDTILWPEYQELSEVLRDYLSEVTDRVIAQAVHHDTKEVEIVKEIELQ